MTRSGYLAAALAVAALAQPVAATAPRAVRIGRVVVKTVPLPPNVILRSATYTPSGKVLVSYAEHDGDAPSLIRLATMDDDGTNFRPFFAREVAQVPKNNGMRYMVFADNRRIFTGDAIVECATSLETCRSPEVLPVAYPSEVADNPATMFRWSEIIPAPDNTHIAWTTLIARTAMVFVGTLRRDVGRYVVDKTQIVSTLDPFRKDPAHADGVLPAPIHGGEVKQFVAGGTALSVVGIVARDLPGSVEWHLASGARDMVTNPPGYTETTIFSPDERLGLTMTTRFSDATNLAVLSLLPRPYPDSLNMGLSMFAYTYSVTGVRRTRPGAIGPALIDIAAARRDPHYLGVDLARDADWSFYSPMSWHPGGKKAMWVEGKDNKAPRIRIVGLPDYRPARPVPAQPTPERIAGGVADLSAVQGFVQRASGTDVRVYGRRSGYITYRKSAGGEIEKRYVGFSDDGRRTYSGVETMRPDPRGTSTYTAAVTLSGADTGVMKLTMSFGPLGGQLPAQLQFDRDAAGVPRTHGYAEFDGKRIGVEGLRP